MTEVMENLFLGKRSHAENAEFLSSKNINFILTVDTRPISSDLLGCSYKHIHAMDESDFDLLQSFPEGLEFMQIAMKSSKLLVHCLQGESRSVTMVLAFLMHHRKIPLKEAWSLLKEKYSSIRPNEGFIQQLLLWGRMGCTLQRDFQAYRLYRMRFLQEAVRNAAVDAFGADPAAAQSGSLDAHYRCRKCRRALFRESAVYPHERGVGNLAFSWRRPVHRSLASEAEPGVGHEDQEAESRAAQREPEAEDGQGEPGAVEDAKQAEEQVKLCHDSLFIEPVQWMEGKLHEMQGKLLCPKCSSKLGSFTWLGERCPCGSWVTPAFHVQTGKVDLSRPRVTQHHR